MSDQTTSGPEQQPDAPAPAPAPRRRTGRGWRILRRLFYFLAGLLLFLQLPFVQQWLAQRVVRSLESRLETRVSLDQA
ncbi:MAG: hypothetical protein KDC54_06460, partial [Lewinella sp.]|nr:hypothetical protein [Lewinella sp.]